MTKEVPGEPEGIAIQIWPVSPCLMLHIALMCSAKGPLCQVVSPTALKSGLPQKALSGGLNALLHRSEKLGNLQSLRRWASLVYGVLESYRPQERDSGQGSTAFCNEKCSETGSDALLHHSATCGDLNGLHKRYEAVCRMPGEFSPQVQPPWLSQICHPVLQQ